MKRLGVVCAVAIGSLAAASALPAYAYRAAPGVRAADIYGRNIQDETVIHLDDYLGSWVLVDFTATWCGPCMREFPHFVEVTDRYRNQGLQVFGVSLDGDYSAERLKPVLRQHGAKFPMIYQGGQFDTPPALEWGINSVPQQFLINPQGVIVASGLQGETLEPLLDFYLHYDGIAPAIGVERIPFWDAENGVTGVDLLLTSPDHEPLEVELVWAQYVYFFDSEEDRQAGNSSGGDWFLGDDKPIMRTVEFPEFCDARIRLEVPLAKDAVGLENVVRVRIPGTEHLMDGKGLWIKTGGWIDIGLGVDEPFWY